MYNLDAGLQLLFFGFGVYFLYTTLSSWYDSYLLVKRIVRLKIWEVPSNKKIPVLTRVILVLFVFTNCSWITIGVVGASMSNYTGTYSEAGFSSIKIAFVYDIAYAISSSCLVCMALMFAFSCLSFELSFCLKQRTPKWLEKLFMFLAVLDIFVSIFATVVSAARNIDVLFLRYLISGFCCLVVGVTCLVSFVVVYSPLKLLVDTSQIVVKPNTSKKRKSIILVQISQAKSSEIEMPVVIDLTASTAVAKLEPDPIPVANSSESEPAELPSTRSELEQLLTEFTVFTVIAFIVALSACAYTLYNSVNYLLGPLDTFVPYEIYFYTDGYVFITFIAMFLGQAYLYIYCNSEK